MKNKSKHICCCDGSDPIPSCPLHWMDELIKSDPSWVKIRRGGFVSLWQKPMPFLNPIKTVY